MPRSGEPARAAPEATSAGLPAKGERPRPFDEQWARLARFQQRHAGLLAALGVLIFGLCLPAAIHLYGDLRTDLRELLPQGAPAAVGLEELEKRLGGLSHLAIVVRTQDLKAGERFVDALVAKLRSLPPTLVARVHSRIEAERTYFELHGALYAELDDLTRVRDALRNQVGEAKKAANPLAVDLLDEDDDDPRAQAAGNAQPAATRAQPAATNAQPAATNAQPAATNAQPGASKGPRGEAQRQLDAAVEKFRLAFGKLDHFPDGYLAGENGTTLVVLLSPPGAAVSLEENQSLMAGVENAVSELRPETFHPSIRIGYGGEVRTIIEAQEALVRDLLLSSILVLVTVALAIFLYYRSIRAIPLLVGPLFIGVSATFALSRLVIHYLNPNTAFLGSIIIGNGINAGIILLARYLEDRRLGHRIGVALETALQSTWQATFAASAAAAASYGTLYFVRFRGFNQFGFMGFAGMLLCWTATYLFMPPYIVVLERFWPFVNPGEKRPATGWLAGPFARFLVRRSGQAVLVAAALVAVSVGAIFRFAKDPIQYDFTKLGSRSGLQDGAAYWDSHVDAVLQSYQTPTVVLTETPQEAEAVAAALEAERDRLGPASTLDSIQTLQKLIPKDQPRKLVLLHEIFELLEPRVIAALPADARPTVQRLKDRTELREVTLRDVPEALTQLFREKGGQLGRLVAAYPTLDTDSRNGKAQMFHGRLVRDTALRAAPKAFVAGQIVLTGDIITTITDDGAFAGGLSFFGVAVLTILVMRSFRHSSWVLGSLCLGVLWMFGALGLFAIKFNFVNFVVLPITFGIGVDYAVNFYQRYRQTCSVGAALSSAGGAVALCSTTTIIGYSALLIADNQAIWSFGLTAVLGEVTCLSAALFALPALLAFRDSRRARLSSLPAPGPGAQGA